MCHLISAVFKFYASSPPPSAYITTKLKKEHRSAFPFPQSEQNIAVSYNSMVCFKIQLGSLSGTVVSSLYTAEEVDLTLVINLSSSLWHCIV